MYIGVQQFEQLDEPDPEINVKLISVFCKIWLKTVLKNKNLNSKRTLFYGTYSIQHKQVTIKEEELLL